MRWVIGDVQGCARELDTLLSWVRFDPDADELWCLGDLVNRGPDSLATLELWRDVRGRSLLGNHDVYALRVRAGLARRKKDTLDALFGDPRGEELLARLAREPVLVHLDGRDGAPEAWLVHAGLHPGWTDLDEVASRVNGPADDPARLEHPDVNYATRVRCCTAEGESCRHSGPPQTCPPPARPWDEFYRGTSLVVHGHWAVRGAYRGRRTMGLDSGCVYGGKLTGWCQEEERLVQVPSRDSGGPIRDFDARRLPER